MNPIIDQYGSEYWYDDNHKLHRDDGPALIHFTGIEYWYNHGSLHRLNGPAIISKPNGDYLGEYYWYQYDQLHRLDGPAVDLINSKQWYINGNFISCKDNKEFLRIVKIKELL
jgi:hypothetical protein